MSGLFSSPKVQPIQTPPPQAPEPETLETLQTTETDTQTKLARTQGAKSLQIPLGAVGGADIINK